MSNYPSGSTLHYPKLIEMECAKCEFHWAALGCWDCGGSYLDNEEDAKCPNCGEWCNE